MKQDKTKLWPILLVAFVLLTLSLNIERVLQAAAYVVNITKPLAFGALIALALDGPVDGFQRILHGKRAAKSRIAAVVLTVATVSLIAIGSFYILVPNLVQSVQKIVERMPYYTAEISKKLGELSARLGVELLPGDWNPLGVDLQRYASAVAVTVMDLARSLVRFSLSVVFAIYLLIRKEKILLVVERARHAFTSRSFYAKLYLYSIDFARTFKRFANGQVIEGVILGSLCFVGMLIIRLPFAALVSVLIALTSLIPVIGAYIGAVPAVLLLLLENPIQALIFVIFLVALQQFEGSVIYPKVVGEAIGLDGLLVFAGVTLGAGIGGIVGVIVGVPLTAVLAKAMTNALEKKEKENRGNRA